MKTSIKAILAVIALGASALFVSAQQVKVVTVDIDKAIQGYYKSTEAEQQLQSTQSDAQKRVDTMIAEGRTMADAFKAAQDSFGSAASSEAVKKKAQDDMQRIAGQLQQKQDEINNYSQQARQYLQQNLMAKRQELVTEISNVATTIGKAKGATLILPRGAVVYADAAYDITEDVIKDLNKNKPASSTVPPVGLPR